MHYLCRRNQGIVPRSLITICTMKSNPAFSKTIQKDALIDVMNQINKTIPDNVSWGFLDVPAHTKGDAIWNTSHQFYCKTTKDVRAGYYLYVFTATALDALLLSTYAPVGSYFMDTLEEDYFGSQAVLIIRVR